MRSTSALGAIASTWFISSMTLPATAQQGPTGIYVLGVAQNNPNTAADERLSGIRTASFVSGFTLRVLWSDIESTQGNYDFSVIDEAIRRLAPLGQRLNLEVLQSMPAYLIAGASATYIDHRGGTSPVPWDPFAQARYAALEQALASHIVADGSNLALRDHPVLASVDASSVGLNFGVRDLNNGIRSHPDYTQTPYINAVIQGVEASRTAFPAKQGFLAFFAFTDGQPGVPVDQQILAALDARYNGPGQPTLALFIENLSDTGPVPLPTPGGTGNNLITWTTMGGSTMMQALDSWLAHRADREPQLASHTPATGIALGFNTYGTRFFELYITDIDGAINGALDAAGRPIINDLAFWSEVLTRPACRCAADYNADGGIDGSDIGAFFADWESSARCSDVNQDGGIDGNDIAAFFSIWERGGC